MYALFANKDVQILLIPSTLSHIRTPATISLTFRNALYVQAHTPHCPSVKCTHFSDTVGRTLIVNLITKHIQVIRESQPPFFKITSIIVANKFDYFLSKKYQLGFWGFLRVLGVF